MKKDNMKITPAIWAQGWGIKELADMYGGRLGLVSKDASLEDCMCRVWILKGNKLFACSKTQ